MYILFAVESKQGFMLNIINIYRFTISCEHKREREREREKEHDMNICIHVNV